MDKSIITGRFSPSAIVAMPDHFISGNNLLPGVGYIEMVFAYCKTQQIALTAVAFVRPCVLPELSGILMQYTK